MKVIMLTGAFAGFAIGVACGWAQDCPASDILWRASVGTYVGGLLMRWWGRLWLKSLRQACRDRAAAAAAAAAEAEKAAQPIATGRS
jgi:hypothetical protein